MVRFAHIIYFVSRCARVVATLPVNWLPSVVVIHCLVRPKTINDAPKAQLTRAKRANDSEPKASQSKTRSPPPQPQFKAEELIESLVDLIPAHLAEIEPASSKWSISNAARLMCALMRSPMCCRFARSARS